MAPFLIQLLVMCLEGQQGVAHIGDPEEAPGFGLPHLLLLHCFGGEPVDERSVCLSTWCKTVFQIKITKSLKNYNNYNYYKLYISKCYPALALM